MQGFMEVTLALATEASKALSAASALESLELDLLVASAVWQQ